MSGWDGVGYLLFLPYLIILGVRELARAPKYAWWEARRWLAQRRLRCP